MSVESLRRVRDGGNGPHRCLAASRITHILLLQSWLLLCLMLSARAQLANNFINVTAIKVKTLPNAVQIRVETDGSVLFGTDLQDFIDFDAGFVPQQTQSLRLRIVRARAKLPTFVPLETYPVDGAVVTLGTENFVSPFFGNGSGNENDPRVQVELRFAAPIKIRNFDDDINFGGILGPLEASVQTSNDRRAIVITIITDRADSLATTRLNRSPRAARQNRLSLIPLPQGHFDLEALHTPLRDVLDTLAQATGTKYLAREEVAATEISLVLPEATPEELLSALEIGYGLGFRDEDGTIVVGRGNEFFTARSFALQNLSPDATRLLFPDFLLPYLRADRENNGLIASLTPILVKKIAADLAKLDVPRAQFEVQVEAWELASTVDVNQTIALSRSVGSDAQTIDFGAGTTSIRVQSGLSAKLTATLNLLSARGRARLVAAPHVTAISGAKGTLFLGQTRYIKILQNRSGGQTAQALPLQIGTTLTVTPRGNDADGDILLDITPRVSTVDDIEAATGLPTLGIREVSSYVRVPEGQTLILSGLDFNFDSRIADKTLKIFPSKRQSSERRALLILVKAHRLNTAPTT